MQKEQTEIANPRLAKSQSLASPRALGTKPPVPARRAAARSSSDGGGECRVRGRVDPELARRSEPCK